MPVHLPDQGWLDPNVLWNKLTIIITIIMKKQWFSWQSRAGIVSSLCFGGWRWKVTQMLAGSGYPAVTPATGLVSKRTQLTGQQYQWADLSAAHASRYFSNCVFFLLFFTLPQFIPGVLEAVEVWMVDFSGSPILALRLVISETMLYIQFGISCICLFCILTVHLIKCNVHVCISMYL